MNPVARAGRIAAILFTLGLGGCMATPYAPFSYWNGGGYTETEVQPNLFLVRFMGNPQTLPDRAGDFALLHAADLCLDRGKNFVLLGELATDYVQSGYIDGTTTTTVVPTSDNAPPIVVTDTTPPTQLFSPASGIAVTCVDDQRKGAWDARYLARSIRSKYRLG